MKFYSTWYSTYRIYAVTGNLPYCNRKYRYRYGTQQYGTRMYGGGRMLIWGKRFAHAGRPVRRKCGRGRGSWCSKRTFLPILLKQTYQKSPFLTRRSLAYHEWVRALVYRTVPYCTVVKTINVPYRTVCRSRKSTVQWNDPYSTRD